jgi:hypothetical protein
MWCWKMLEKISWIDGVKIEEVLRTQSQGGKEQPTYNKTKEV